MAKTLDKLGQLYYAALRKMIMGVVATGRFEIAAPRDTHLILKLENVRLTLDGVNNTLDLPGNL